LHNEELHSLYSSDEVKEDEMGRSYSLDEVNMKAYRFLVGKPEGNSH
jgi:hypothetical protein